MNLQENINRIKEIINQINEQSVIGAPNYGTGAFYNKKTNNTPTNKPINKPVVNKSIDFLKIVDLVIKHIEGGYYHPSMKKSGMGKSGETMFGIDRKNSPEFTKSSAGRQFWGLVDNDKSKNPKKWKYLYTLDDNPTLSNQLKTIIGNSYLSPNYENFGKSYLTPEAKKVVEDNSKLKFHMGYGTWNGMGWFRKFAKAINDAVAGGTRDPKTLESIALNSRIKSGNELIAKGGNKIASKVFPEIGGA
jgi:hypothetical protein